MNICFLTRSNPNHQKSWSGTYFQMFTYLKKYYNVEWIGEIRLSKIEYGLLETQFKENGYKKITCHNRLLCTFLAKHIENILKSSHYDIIFAPAASELIAYLETNIPIVYLSDTTFKNMLDYYPAFSGLNKRYIDEGNEVELRAISKAWKIIYSSSWAAESAISFYKADKSKINIIDFGANLLYVPQKLNIPLLRSEANIYNLLFLGADWVRKGGELAYKVFLQLRIYGIQCKLTIVGCNPKLEEGLEDILIIPFLDKENSFDFNLLYNLFLRSHLLLLPVKADCTPIVFSEAAAFGVPVITTNTGGISSVIKEGINGYLMSTKADEKEYAERIKYLFENKETYHELCCNSRVEYEMRLNWQSWVNKFNQVVL